MLIINPNKQVMIEAEGVQYERYAIKTHVITDEDRLEDIVNQYAVPEVQAGDIVFFSEKMVACTQKRAILLSDIHPRRLAVLLSRFVRKTKRGIGLGMPETMEMAFRECGTLRILFASIISIIGKCLGQRGWFYHIAGKKASTIDGPCSYTLPPYNNYVVLGPHRPEETAKKCYEILQCPVLIADINDYGAEILGSWPAGINIGLMKKVLKDNPLGQSSQCTPIGVIRAH